MAVTVAAWEPMNITSTVEKFSLLFKGNPWRHGVEDGGSCDNGEKTWMDLCAEHLLGGEPIGAYPIDPRTNRVRWGCVDFDEGDEESFYHAYRLEYFLGECGIASSVERSRSKGYHVWVFCSSVDAAIMRHALLYACEFIGAPTKEINPKQERLAEGQLGNYVRLPYPGWLDPTTEAYRQYQGCRRVIVNTETETDVTLDEFVDEWAMINDPHEIKQLASWYKPTAPHKHSAYTFVVEPDTEPLLENLSRSARRLFENGPKQADRSSTLCALAGDIARTQVEKSPQECLAVLRAADMRWGKYSERHDVDQRLIEIVERAYSDLEGY